MVVTARNPVHSVLFLILAFFNAAGLFLLLGAEFLAMILVVVYVGAVAVLFLFVVMMLNINFVILREGFLQYLPVGGLVGLILLVELALVSGGWAFAPEVAAAAGTPSTLIAPSGVMTNTRALGDVLYTQYFYLFLGGGAGASGGHDRGHCPDPPFAAWRAEAGHFPTGVTAPQRLR